MQDLQEAFRRVFEELNESMAIGVYFSKGDIEFLEEQVKTLNEDIQIIKDRLSGKKPMPSEEDIKKVEKDKKDFGELGK